MEELKYFQKKYLFKIEILSDQNLIIPEYKIDLYNKSKKIINTIENLNRIIEVKKLAKNATKKIKSKKRELKKDKKVSKKTKLKKNLRTLWTRRKKN